jgi:hypothetical protein
MEDRPVVSRSSIFCIDKFKDIFKQKDEKEEAKEVFKMHSNTRDLVYFTLFICRAFGMKDSKQIDDKIDFYSEGNMPTRGLIQLATELEHDYIVEQLIRSNIDVNLVDQSHQSAFDMAVDRNLVNIKHILLKRSDLVPNQNNVKLDEHPLRI